MASPSPSYHHILAQGLDRVTENWNVPYMEDVCGLTIADVCYLSRLLAGEDYSLLKLPDSKVQLARHLVALMDSMPELPSGEPV